MGQQTIDLSGYKENTFNDMKWVDIDKERYQQLLNMMYFVGKRPKQYLREESYLEGMCYHHNLFDVDSNHKAKLVAKLVNDFDKSFYYYEMEKTDGKM